MLIIQISKSSSRPRSAKRTRSVHCVMLDSIWISAARTSSLFSTRTPTTQFASLTSSCAHMRTTKISVSSVALLARSSKQSKLASCSVRWQRLHGPAPTQEFNMTTPSMIGTQTQRQVASMRLTLALSTCHSITLHVTWHRLTCSSSCRAMDHLMQRVLLRQLSSSSPRWISQSASQISQLSQSELQLAITAS